MKVTLKMYFQLFYYMFITSAFTFGGGFVIMPLYKKRFVDDLKWISEDEMVDLIILAQSAPGSIAVNASILLGQKVFGMVGTLVAVLATVLPPMIIISLISVFYQIFKTNIYINSLLLAMRGVIAATVIDISLTMALQIKKDKDYLGIIVMIIAFLVAVFTKVNVIYIIIVAGVIGLIRAIIEMKCKKEEPKENAQ